MRALTRSIIGPVAGLIGSVLAATVVGCVAPPAGDASLDQARAAVERARGAPRVRALAPAELDQAEVALQRARAAAEAGAPAGHVEHLAYAASRQAALAEAHAADRVAQAEVELLQRALDRVPARAPEDLREDRVAAETQPAETQPAATRPAATQPAATQPAATSAAPLPDVTLDLSELSFEDAEPSRETATRLDEVADLLIGEPARKISIAADFNLPDPVARTLMERRIETVRAAFLGRGIDASRIAVRADAAPEGRAVSSFERLAP